MAASTVSDRRRASSTGAAPLFLVVVGPKNTVTLELPARDVVLIGRAEDAPVRLTDPLASRQHARLFVADNSVEIEDLHSANGTRVREREISPGTRVAVQPGEAITIGSSVLLLHSQAPRGKALQVWPHAYFEERLIEECGRAERARAALSLVRVRFASEAAAEEGRGAMTKPTRAGDVVATYGPREYEILLIDAGVSAAAQIAGEVAAALKARRLDASIATATYPIDGRSPQALVSCASAGLCAGLPNPRGPALTDGLVVENAEMRDLYARAATLAADPAALLVAHVVGEVGVGKQVLAESIHRASVRAGAPFLVLDCANAAERELDEALAAAAPSGGTVLLDEIDEAPLAFQAALVRLLERGQLVRGDSVEAVPFTARLVASSTRAFDEAGTGRPLLPELARRLAEVRLAIPALGERLDEIGLLAAAFVTEVADKLGRTPPRISSEALEILYTYGWPGNLRELHNVIERAVILCSDDLITELHLPAQRMKRVVGRVSPSPYGPTTPEPVRGRLPPRPLRGQQDTALREAIVDALARCSGSPACAGELLGMPARRLSALMKQLKIREGYRASG